MIDGLAQQFGFDPIDRSDLDNDDGWTFVNKAPFPTAGQIVAIEFFVGRNFTPLRFGLYRPSTPGVYDLVTQLEYPDGFPLGKNKVRHWRPFNI